MAKRKVNIEKVEIEYKGKTIEHYKKDSFLIYTNNYLSIKYLNDEQAGKLFKALFLYNMGELEEADTIMGSDPMIMMAWGQIKNYMDDNADEYYHVCQTNVLNGKKGAAKKRLSAYKNMEDYCRTDKQKIMSLIGQADIDIHDAETIDEVDKIVEKYMKSLDCILPVTLADVPF